MAHGHSHHHHHHHQHHEVCSPDRSSDLGQKNKNHFDDVAATVFDTPWIVKLCSQIQEELKDQISWIGYQQPTEEKSTKMLDYACGNGIASRALASYFSTIHGMDISEGMVKQYNVKAKDAGYSESKMQAVAGDLVNGSAAVDPSFADFDLIIMSMALHHVDDPKAMIQKLSERLGHGGVLLFVDWVAASESGCSAPKPPGDHPVRHTVSRMGFEKNELEKWFHDAGLNEFEWKWFSSRSMLPDEIGGEKQLFLAKATR